MKKPKDKLLAPQEQELLRFFRKLLKEDPAKARELIGLIKQRAERARRRKRFRVVRINHEPRT